MPIRYKDLRKGMRVRGSDYTGVVVARGAEPVDGAYADILRDDGENGLWRVNYSPETEERNGYWLSSGNWSIGPLELGKAQVTGYEEAKMIDSEQTINEKSVLGGFWAFYFGCITGYLVAFILIIWLSL